MKCMSQMKSQFAKTLIATSVATTVALFFALTLSSAPVAAAPESSGDVTMTAKDLKFAEMTSKVKGMIEVANHLAGLSLTCQTASDCVAIPMGARACGGPNYFIFTSYLNPSMTAARETAALITKTEKEMIATFRMMSVCSVELPPDLTCVENTCGQP